MTSSDFAVAPGAGHGMGLIQKLGSLFRTYAIPRNSVVVKPPYAQEDRKAFTFLVPPEWESDENGTSTVKLLEDGLALGPPHSNHDDVRTLGGGRYSHWGSKIYFSTSDGSDPNTNGRTYSVVPPAGWEGSDDDEWTRGDEVVQVRCGDTVSVEWTATDVLPDTILATGGHVYSVQVPAEWPSDNGSFSTLMLLEDGKPLPHPHSPHHVIASEGCGRYAHWDNELRFATSDNTDPRTNGRRYSIAHADAFIFGHALEPPAKEQGHCWILSFLPKEWTSDQDGVSHLQLLEDGKLLGPSHASHDEIRQLGKGRYCHWGRDLWFSTSDDSDPRTNGRTYTVVWPAD